MKKRTKEITIIVPLVGLTILLIAGFLLQPPYDYTPESPVLSTETTCQLGWYKYDLESGTLCSKTELTESQIQEYIGN